MKEIFDKNNFDHVMFHGDQESLDKANARKSFWEMVEQGIVGIEEKERVFDEIDKGNRRILIKVSSKAEIIKTFLER